MADYGLKIFDSDGNVTLDVSDKITRFRYSDEVAAGASSNTTLSDISGLSSVQFSIPTTKSVFDCPHSISRDVTTISWAAQNVGAFDSTNSLIFVFLYT